MAQGTLADHLAMINPVRRHRYPAGRIAVMAGITDIGGGNMHSRGLATGEGAVMALDTVADKGTVIGHATGTTEPGIGGMTLVALGTGDHVGRALATGNDAVVTAAADTNGLGMIHLSRQQR